MVDLGKMMCKGTMLVFWWTLVLLVAHGESQQLRGHRTQDPSEVLRQNRITQQILAQYLQRRLFPHVQSATTPLRNTQRERRPPPNDADGDDRLETVESEQISNVYFTSEGYHQRLISYHFCTDIETHKWSIATMLFINPSATNFTELYFRNEQQESSFQKRNGKPTRDPL